MMKLVTIALALFAIVSSAQEESDVLVLTSENFDTTINSNKFVFVEFYAPWCGHCKRLAPDYEKVATALKGEVPVAKVDCDANGELCGNNGIQGYPTLRFFKNGESLEYNGGRTPESIIAYIRKKSGPTTVVLGSAEEIKTFSAKTPTVVGYFSSKEGNHASFLSAADQFDEYTFAEVNDASVISASGIADGSVVFYRGALGEDKTFDFSSDDELDAWIRTYSLPLVGEVTPENYAKYAQNQVPLLLAFVDLANEEQKKSVIDAYTANAAANFGKFTFGYIDGPKFVAQAQRMGATSSNLPIIIQLDFTTGKNIVYDESKPVTVEGIKAFTDGILSGEIKYLPKSEPIPETNDGPVTIIVGKNFDQIVLDTTKDVLVEYYAPWCGHCKTLAPIYEEVGAAFAKVDSVVIAKVDATSNDITREEIQGFPTIKFYPANSKDTSIDYEGERTVEGFLAFIKQHASIPYTLDAAEAKDEL
eukprot:TRINITY_DN24018_c0_g1_i1.p2 TRINITY_DN24018_c0_g1~~TRINITY_DN24018_c0_g1_i1.p2  ORF type:complete len:476 (-),score=180.95 TRINITY_DN24018_c0_g1_i1:36-1463(-)